MNKIKSRIAWIEFKQLDRSTNSSTRIEMIKILQSLGMHLHYYCTYKKEKVYYDLSPDVIKYLYGIKNNFVNKLVQIFQIFFINIYWVVASPYEVIIIDYTSLWWAWAAILLKRVFNNKLKYVLDIRTFPVDVEQFNRQMIGFRLALYLANNWCDGITFITPFMKQYVTTKFNINLKSTIWTSGFNSSYFTPVPHKKKHRERFQLFYHGGLSISRGIFELIKATKILHDQNIPVELKLIGNMVDNESIQTFIKKNNMQDYCIISHPVPYKEIPRLISNADLPVIPLPNFIGWRVSCPLKLIEYLAMGKSVVLTDIEAHRNVVNGHSFAFYAKSGASKDLVKAIRKAYSQKSNLEAFGEDARKLALEQYSWEKQGANLYNFLNSL